MYVGLIITSFCPTDECHHRATKVCALSLYVCIGVLARGKSRSHSSILHTRGGAGSK